MNKATAIHIQDSKTIKEFDEYLKACKVLCEEPEYIEVSPYGPIPNCRGEHATRVMERYRRTDQHATARNALNMMLNEETQ